jgi:cellobiose phosphorylase
MTKAYTIRNAYGYYDDATGEYVITRPDTPTPWMNYIGEGRYGGIVSNTGGGYSFDRDPRNRRVTRYRYNAVPVDQPGRYVYLRDQDTGEYWSPTWQPVVSRKLDAYECRHGPGYTSISSTYQGIQASIQYFVPPYPEDDACPCEVWVLKIKNTSAQPRKLRTFSYAELSFWTADVDLHNLDWGAHIVGTHQQDGVLYTSTYFRPTTSYFSSDFQPIGFDSDRETFIGAYRDLANPIVVEIGKSMKTEAPRGNNIASLCHSIHLEPDEEKEIIYILGVTDSPDLILPKVKHYRDPHNVKRAFEMLKADWKEFLGKIQVHTPDPEMNAMLNVWNQVQCRTTLFWSRFVSAYETGLGRGMGTRDSAQDTLATVQNAPERVKQNLVMLWKLQFQDGHVWHQVFPLTGEGGPGLAAEFPDWPQWFSDDHLWLVQAVVNHLRETGDFAFLDESIPYYDSGSDTLWAHLLRAVEFTMGHRGPQGLPRLGFSDWDDTMNLDHGSGKAESVMTAQLFCWVMLELSDLCEALGKDEESRRFKSYKTNMEEIINRVAWDGDWYARAYDDNGLPVGVKTEDKHRIALNTQTWAVIGDCAPRERAERAMNSAHEKLNTPFGVAIIWPPYDGSDERVRGTSTYPPGAKENGGIFNHANTWAIVAAAKLGWADRAYQYYRQSMPLARKDNDHFKVEPYVYCGNLAGPTHPQFGYGRNAWLSGTAAWMYIAGTQWILGIRPTFQGLRIAPVIPQDWTGFTVSRVFRGIRYHIAVERKGPGNKVSLNVDDKNIASNIIPFPPAGKTNLVVIVTLS